MGMTMDRRPMGAQYQRHSVVIVRNERWRFVGQTLKLLGKRVTYK